MTNSPMCSENSNQRIPTDVFHNYRELDPLSHSLRDGLPMNDKEEEEYCEGDWHLLVYVCVCVYVSSKIVQ